MLGTSKPFEGHHFSGQQLGACTGQAIEGGIDSSHVSFLHGGALKTDPLFVGSKGNEYNDHDRMPFFEVADFPGGLLIGARRNVTDDPGKYYWRITPYIMPMHTIIPPRAGHPLFNAFVRAAAANAKGAPSASEAAPKLKSIA